ncbi:hypothetical protein Y032_0339g2955 [Ancylostoma ceylanicum]|uniref:ZP domain-containing protein n=1 Tax=Ancylostoma ceylanicum TaxID=53326 RepID=A0A016RZ23_9BILA|nr:hypothetical protein Y032_0339g2955 [Ancylostoma ceylanicum]
MPSTGTWTGVNAHLIWLLWFVDTARAQFGLTYKEPRLECLPDGIRLHIDPVGVFFGHVYVRGHFKENKCHLNYCTQSTREPFTMEVPYRGECNVRRHRSAPVCSSLSSYNALHPIFEDCKEAKIQQAPHSASPLSNVP